MSSDLRGIRQRRRGQSFHFGHFKIVLAKNQGTGFQLNRFDKARCLESDHATRRLAGNVRGWGRHAKPAAANPGGSDQQNYGTQTAPRSIHRWQGNRGNARGEHFGGARQKIAAGKYQQSMPGARLRRGRARLHFERVGGRKLQNVIGRGGICRLSEERQRTGGKPMMMRRGAVGVMQNQTNAVFGRAAQKIVIGIERARQSRQSQPQRRARAGIQQQSAPGGREPKAGAGFVAGKIHSVGWCERGTAGSPSRTLERLENWKSIRDWYLLMASQTYDRRRLPVNRVDCFSFRNFWLGTGALSESGRHRSN